MIVTTLLVGTVAGAVYNPPLVMDPVPVPLTVQFTRVLLRFVTVAVHCEVPSTVTLAGTHEIVIVGDVVVVAALLPQEERIAGTPIRAKKKRILSQRALSRPKWKNGSSTRNPPARTMLIFLKKMRSRVSRRPYALDAQKPNGDCA